MAGDGGRPDRGSGPAFQASDPSPRQRISWHYLMIADRVDTPRP